MTAEEWALAASVFFSGLAAGFLGGLCTIIRPMQAAMTGPDFRGIPRRCQRTGRQDGSATSRSTGSNWRLPGQRSPSSWWR